MTEGATQPGTFPRPTSWPASLATWPSGHPQIDDPNAVSDEDWVEDYLQIERVDPGHFVVRGRSRPAQVPKQASALAEEGWSVNVVLARVRGIWHLVEVGNVYP